MTTKFKIVVVATLTLLSGLAFYNLLAKPKFATATDLWAKATNGQSCCRLTNTTGALSALLQTSLGGMQAQIKSNGGTLYNLYEDVSCSRPVYFSGC